MLRDGQGAAAGRVAAGQVCDVSHALQQAAHGVMAVNALLQSTRTVP